MNFLSSSYNLDVSPLLNVQSVKIFSHSVPCHFVQMIVLFTIHIFNSTRSYLLIVLSFFDNSVQKVIPCANELRTIPTFSSIRFKVSRLTLKSLTHLVLSFVQGNPQASVFILLYAAVQFYLHYLLKMLYFFQCVFLTSSSKIMYLYVFRFISVSSIQFH